MVPARSLCRLPGIPTVSLRLAFTALAVVGATATAVPAAAQNEVTVRFEYSEYSVPEGYFPDGSISYSQVNIFLSAAPNTFPAGTFDLDSSGRLQVPLTREMVGGAQHGVDFHGVSAYVRFEPDETTAFLRIFPQADNRDEVGEGVKIGFGTPPRGVRIGTPSTATVMIEEPGMPDVIMSASPGSVSENGGVSTVTAWLGYATEYEVTVTVRVEVGSGASSDDITLSENRTLTIPANSRWSTGTVTVTAVDDSVFNPTKVLWVRGSVAGLPGTTEASARNLYLEDDDTPVVTLSVVPARVDEDDGTATLTITGGLDQAIDSLTSVVVAGVGGTATSGDDYRGFDSFGFDILEGQTTGTQTLSLTLLDDEETEGDETLLLGGTATGLIVESATLTIADDETPPPAGHPHAVAGLDLREPRRQHDDGESGSRGERGRPGDGIGGGGVPGGRRRLRVEHDHCADDHGRTDFQHRHGHGDGARQRRGCAGQGSHGLGDRQ